MFKNTITILALCFALFIIATACSNSVNNNGSANAAPVCSAVINSGSNSLSLLAATPNSYQKMVQVRLTKVETNGDLIDSPIAFSTIFIKVGEAIFEKKTDADGVVVFDSVPCGSDVEITASDEESEEDTIIKTSFSCEGAQVDLGVLTKPFGAKFILEKRKTQFIEYDPMNNEWRSQGKVFPAKKVAAILDKYMPN